MMSDNGLIVDTLAGMRKSSMPPGMIHSAVPESTKKMSMPSLTRLAGTGETLGGYTLGMGAPFPGAMSFAKKAKKSKKGGK